MSEKQEYQSPLIDHLPSREELLTANEAGSEEVSEHTIPREHLDKIMRGMGYSKPEKVISQTVNKSVNHQPTPNDRKDIISFPKPTTAGLQDLKASRSEMRKWLEEDKINNPDD